VILNFGICLVLGAWNLDFGTWNLEPSLDSLQIIPACKTYQITPYI